MDDQTPEPYMDSPTPVGRVLSLILAADVPVSEAAEIVGIERSRLMLATVVGGQLSPMEFERLTFCLRLSWIRWLDRHRVAKMDQDEVRRIVTLLAVTA